MTPAARQVLQLRKSLSKSSVSKLGAIVENVSPDNRLRYQYQFYGATTGRWSGKSVQLQNLPREASVWGGQEINLRSAFQAPDGYKFVVADLSAIEVRVLAWLTRCPLLLDVFARGQDPYISFAAYLFTKSEQDVTKSERQIAKSAVLGCGYQLSGGELKMDCCWELVAGCKCEEGEVGDEVKTGLWGYAENIGIPMEREVAHEAVAAYRERYREVVDFWYAVEDAAVAAVHSGQPQVVNGIRFWTVPEKVLCADLPSGRRLHYLNPQLGPGKFNRPSLTHYTHGLKGWVREQLYGGLITENLVQAIARDVLAEGMLRADNCAYNIVGHTHDEIICLELDKWNLEESLQGLIDHMTLPMYWALDLPLAAEGYTAKVYRK